MTDNVNRPAHYQPLFETRPIECIDITRHMDFCLGNAFKYVWRAGRKGDKAQSIEDCDKAIFYLSKAVASGRYGETAWALFLQIVPANSPRYNALSAIIRGERISAIHHIRELKKELSAVDNSGISDENSGGKNGI